MGGESTLQAAQTAENPVAATSASSSEPSAMLTTSVDTTEEFQTLLRQVGQNLSEAEVREWLATDEHDQGYKHLNEDEIIETIVQQNKRRGRI